MKGLHLDYTNSFVKEEELSRLEPVVRIAHEQLHQGTGAGANYLGWLSLPDQRDSKEWEELRQTAAEVRSNGDALVVIGIGGSYLGARAAWEMLGHSFYNQLSTDRRQGPEIYFAGHHLSPVYMVHLLQHLEGKRVWINMISKSGTTTEPAIAFRIIRDWMEKQVGKAEAKRRIIATTDSHKGALKQLAKDEGFRTFVIPDNVGGRYSVLTPVGLLPMAVAGIDVDEVMEGAQEACHRYGNPSLTENPAYQYAGLRNLLYRKGKTTELLVHYEPHLHSFAEWWKQLYGESEGKDHTGIFPASVQFTTDLHSMGQYIQEGRRNLFETVLRFRQPQLDITIPTGDQNGDGLDYLAGKTLDFVNRQACQGTLLAHTDGGVPNILLTLPEMTPHTFGHMIYFFEKACGISGYLSGVNPFDQPGVEAYKKNMFALLGKPGYEQEKETLQKRLSQETKD